MSEDLVPLPWVKASERLPDFNRRVLAWLEGSKDHSGMTWKRSGYAFMIRHDDAQFTVADQWATCFYTDALKQMGADEAAVTHWFYLRLPVVEHLSNDLGSQPAFPEHAVTNSMPGAAAIRTAVTGGLTKRELFAAMAMQGLIGPQYEHMVGHQLAVEAIAYADALLAALKEVQP